MNPIGTRTVSLSILGIACLAPLPGMADACQPYWTAAYKCAQGCGPCGGSSGNSGNSGYDDGAVRRAQQAEAAAAAERQRQQAAEAERIERERVERERIAAKKRADDAAFIRDRDAAASSLKGSSGGGDAVSQLKGLAGADNPNLKGSGFDSGSGGLKELHGSDRTDGQKALSQPTRPAPNTDTAVVDARKVPSGLPKSLDNAIAKAYSSAPPGVSDRVRKGFQAVMARDWKVAKAWFQDALKRDPDNAGLKRLVALTDAPQQADKQPASTDVKVTGKPKSTSIQTDKSKLQLPDPNDIYVSFPGLKAMEDKVALDYLFGLDPSPSAAKPRQTK